LIKLTNRLLASLGLEVVRILAKIPILVMATCTKKWEKYTYQN